MGNANTLGQGYKYILVRTSCDRHELENGTEKVMWKGIDEAGKREREREGQSGD